MRQGSLLQAKNHGITCGVIPCFRYKTFTFGTDRKTDVASLRQSNYQSSHCFRELMTPPSIRIFKRQGNSTMEKGDASTVHVEFPTNSTQGPTSSPNSSFPPLASPGLVHLRHAMREQHPSTTKYGVLVIHCGTRTSEYSYSAATASKYVRVLYLKSRSMGKTRPPPRFHGARTQFGAGTVSSRGRQKKK